MRRPSSAAFSATHDAPALASRQRSSFLLSQRPERVTFADEKFGALLFKFAFFLLRHENATHAPFTRVRGKGGSGTAREGLPRKRSAILASETNPGLSDFRKVFPLEKPLRRLCFTPLPEAEITLVQSQRGHLLRQGS
jgi:hypothetical protein